MIKRYTLAIDIPAIFKFRLQEKLDSELIKIQSVKSKKSFEKRFWKFSAFLVNKCVYNNDDRKLFVNITFSEIKKFVGGDNNAINAMRKILYSFFECNEKYSTGLYTTTESVDAFSKSYRLRAEFFNDFEEKYMTTETVIFDVAETYLTEYFYLSKSVIKKLSRNEQCVITIKNPKHVFIPVDNEEEIIQIYPGRTEINKWEEVVAERLTHISVDINALNKHQGNDLKKLFWIGRILNASSTKKPTFKHGRLYWNPFFHSLPSEYRQYCRYDKNEKLVEVFDVKSCFAQLVMLVIKNKVSKNTYEKFYNVVIKQDIYTVIAKIASIKNNKKYTRDDLKRPFLIWLFKNNFGKQHCWTGSLQKIVNDYFETNFKEIYDVLTSFKEIKVIKGKRIITKSTLSVICQWIENKYMLNGLAKDVEEFFNVHVLTLHDAIWLKESEAKLVDENLIRKMWYKKIGF